MGTVDSAEIQSICLLMNSHSSNEFHQHSTYAFQQPMVLCVIHLCSQMYELSAARITEHFIGQVDSAIDATARAMSSYVRSFVRTQLDTARNQIEEYSQRHVAHPVIQKAHGRTEYKHVSDVVERDIQDIVVHTGGFLYHSRRSGDPSIVDAWLMRGKANRQADVIEHSSNMFPDP